MRRPVESKGDSTCDATLSGAIGAKYHVQVRTRAKLDPIIRDKVAQLDAHDGSRDEPRRDAVKGDRQEKGK